MKDREKMPLENAFRETPPAFAAGVEDTLRRLQEKKEEIPVKRKMPMALVIAMIVTLLLAGVACAASLSPTIDWFGWFYGDDLKQTLEQGDVALANLTQTLGDLTYTLDDVVYAEGVLYGSGTIAVKDGASAVLITEDYEVDEPAGYMLHIGEEEIPENAPTYAQLAREKDCRILHGKLVPKGYLVNGELYTGDIGYSLLPQQDGTIRFAFEIYVGDADPTATAVPGPDPSKEPELAQNPRNFVGIGRAPSYTLVLGISNWEVTETGEWLREEPNNTWLKEEWTVTVTPAVK